MFFEEFNLIFFTAERLACFEMQPRQQRVGGGTFLLYGQGNYVFKGKFCIYKCFIDVKFIVVLVFIEKLQNVPRLEMACFFVEFCRVLSRFLLS